MVLEIDFTNKVIVVLEEVDAKSLIDYIVTLQDWEEYTIDCREIFYVPDNSVTTTGFGEDFYTITLN